ncbi:MAG: 4Fe-4S double cluster binding domain-containing protein [Desulfosarcinaceae bacterium]|jgi:epoxyqueuosine reductase QueG
MVEKGRTTPSWLTDWMRAHGIHLWGGAYLKPFATPRDVIGERFPRAISMAFPMSPKIFAGVQKGPNDAYAEEYTRVNARINKVSAELAADIRARGFQAKPLAASIRSDPVNIMGDFPHKTAATRAGLGWIGRHSQLITRAYGPWLRLGTVFTDMQLPCGPPQDKHHCGRCRRCVDACPAGAIEGSGWTPGIPRDELIDVQRCDDWKKKHYFQYHQGHNCGICAAVCPYGLKLLRKLST